MIKYFVLWIALVHVMSFGVPNLDQIEFAACIGEEIVEGQSPVDAYATCEAQHNLEMTAKHTVARPEVERSSRNHHDSPSTLSLRQDGTRKDFVECIESERAGGLASVDAFEVCEAQQSLTLVERRRLQDPCTHAPTPNPTPMPTPSPTPPTPGPTPSPTPSPTPGSLSRAVCKGVAAGYEHSCGVRGGDGHAVCWGDNTYDGATPPTPRTAIVITAAGYEFGMAVRSSDAKPLCVVVVVDGRAMRCVVHMRRVASAECAVAAPLFACVYNSKAAR